MSRIKQSDSEVVNAYATLKTIVAVRKYLDISEITITKILRKNKIDICKFPTQKIVDDKVIIELFWHRVSYRSRNSVCCLES